MQHNESGLIPVGDRLIVRTDKTDEKTAGGIIVLEKSRDQQDMATTKATVIALGETANCHGLKTFPCVGDRILMAKWAGTGHHSPDLPEYRAIMGDDVIAIIDKEST